MITADYVKEGAVVIDVGIHRPEGGKLCGDVDFDSVENSVGNYAGTGRCRTDDNCDVDE